MPTKPMSDAIGVEALDAFARNNENYADAAREIGEVYGTFYSRVKLAKKRGLHLSEGARNMMNLSGRARIRNPRKARRRMLAGY